MAILRRQHLVDQRGRGAFGITGLQHQRHTLLRQQQRLADDQRWLVDIGHAHAQHLGGAGLAVADGHDHLVDTVAIGVARHFAVGCGHETQCTAGGVDGEQGRVGATGDGKAQRAGRVVDVVCAQARNGAAVFDCLQRCCRRAAEAGEDGRVVNRRQPHGGGGGGAEDAVADIEGDLHRAAPVGCRDELPAAATQISQRRGACHHTQRSHAQGIAVGVGGARQQCCGVDRQRAVFGPRAQVHGAGDRGFVDIAHAHGDGLPVFALAVAGGHFDLVAAVAVGVCRCLEVRRRCQAQDAAGRVDAKQRCIGAADQAVAQRGCRQVGVDGADHRHQGLAFCDLEHGSVGPAVGGDHGRAVRWHHRHGRPELRRVAMRADSALDHRHRADDVADADRHATQRGGEAGVAARVGADGGGAEPDRARSVAAGMGAGGAEELDAVGRVRVALQRAGNQGVGACTDGAAEHRVVLQVVGTAVDVAGIVAGDAVAAEVDVEPAAVEDAVAQPVVAAAGRAGHAYAFAGAVGDEVAGAGCGAADAHVVHAAAQVDAPLVAERLVAAADAEPVAGDDGVGGAAVEPDAGTGAAGDEVGVQRRGAADGDAAAAGPDAGPAIAGRDAPRDIGAQEVADQGVQVAADDLQRVARVAADDQTLHRAAVAAGDQPQAVRQPALAIELDHRRAGKVALAAAVDQHRARQVGQRAGKLQRVAAQL